MATYGSMNMTLRSCTNSSLSMRISATSVLPPLVGRAYTRFILLFTASKLKHSICQSATRTREHKRQSRADAASDRTETNRRAGRSVCVFRTCAWPGAAARKNRHRRPREHVSRESRSPPPSAVSAPKRRPPSGSCCFSARDRRRNGETEVAVRQSPFTRVVATQTL